MNEAVATMPPAPSMADWQPLPARARALFVLSRMGLAIPAAFAGFVLGTALDGPGLLGALCGVVVVALGGLWLGLRQFRHVAWRLDEDGIAIRRGRMFQRETRVPATRVQHLDLKRGPLQRRRRLATLVVHTAGTRHSAVTLAHLDEGDAERLRDVLGRQIDHDDD
ncbi:PH domain-containing protein [Lysobacter solisilvae (ex Woo and Kim 2020)]|uniref:PH domain-containing protein n=1 Tax=Agrilutibacter terrestris TaxID=2865112 RepID=A0A7H0FUC9_9GAMM|nr:PH domain-containing protein [Lysobacter terrestris]QNP39645.1 PH domain-containing protein [Lysobacter terrestris]